MVNILKNQEENTHSVSHYCSGINRTPKTQTSGSISEHLVFCHSGISFVLEVLTEFFTSQLSTADSSLHSISSTLIYQMHKLHIHRAMTSNLWTLTSPSGHEFPFSIKMSHIRDGGSSGGGLGVGAGRDPTSPTDCPGVLLLDQCLPPDTQCQFILKPSKVAPGQVPLIGKTAGPDYSSLT